MKFSYIIITFFCNILGITCSDIVGCGGFLKTDIKGFSYEKLSVHLTFLDGTVNYITDILPNGAYSVPIYDSGAYIIKIICPKGWHIEPIDGYKIVINSQETCPDDYNFKFIGFSIYGKVSTANINHGPPGIFINLVQYSKIISETTTIDGGDFTINNVIPGNYSLHFKSVTADGKSLELNDTNYSLVVINENVYIKESFIIYGYPVFGDVKFYGEPVKEVEFFIFSKTIGIKSFNISKYKCLKFDKKILNIQEYNALCKTVSNVKGEFIFPLLPGGKYLIVPKYESNISIYDLNPNNYEFEITSSSIDLRSIFHISGFSVNGQIITFDHVPIFEAEVYVDGNLATKSDVKGNFTLRGINKGNHEISILINGYLFNKTVVNFNPKNPNIGIFSPEKLSICGSIVIENINSVGKAMNDLSIRRKILLINESTGEIMDFVYTQIQDVENTNYMDKGNTNIISTFCFYAQPGKYIIKPIVDPSNSALSLAPNQITISLKSSPLTVMFSPFRGIISGFVKCIELCTTGEFEVTLKSKDKYIDSIQLTQHISISKELSNQGYFQFKDIIPGNYQIELISANSNLPLNKNRWCWSEFVLTVSIVDSNINNLIFQQVGFSVPISSSHDVKIDYYHLNFDKIFIKSKILSKGISQICLPNPGKYEIKINTCHKLDNTSYLINLNEICDKYFDFRNPQCHIKINIIEFKVKVKFEVTDYVNFQNVETLKNNVKLLIRSNSKDQPVITDIIWNSTSGYLDFWVQPDLPIEIHVDSSKYLVKPQKINFQLPKETFNCITEVGTFQLEPGTFINGSILPMIEGVHVEIRKHVSPLDEEDIELMTAISKTNEKGQFIVGPLNSSFKYKIKLFKNGYKIVENINSPQKYQYNAYKLAELIVNVIDNYTGNPLHGILLSIVGDDLRKNELTNEEGKFTFVGLTPGIYYLRAMMKELEFIPFGAVEVKIVEGNVEEILIKAARTSFSLHGKVVALNGDPEPGVIIEGNSFKNLKEANYNFNCKNNLIRNEHATSDELGTFRIRGLQPGCFYKLSLRNINFNEENAIIRSYPNNINIKMPNNDVFNIKLYALRNIDLREISAMVWTNNDVYQASLNLLVFPSDNPDNVIAAHKFVSEGIYFQMSLPQIYKRMEYVIRLQSNLNPALYSNISAQEQIYRIEGDIKSYKHFEFHFYPVKKSISDSDITITLSSSLILPFVIIFISAIFFKNDSFESLVLKFIKFVQLKMASNFKNSNMTFSSGAGLKSESLDSVEISELNNFIAKPKSTVILQSMKKAPFWSRPKKT